MTEHHIIGSFSLFQPEAQDYFSRFLVQASFLPPFLSISSLLFLSLPPWVDLSLHWIDSKALGVDLQRGCSLSTQAQVHPCMFCMLSLVKAGMIMHNTSIAYMQGFTTKYYGLWTRKNWWIVCSCCQPSSTNSNYWMCKLTIFSVV